jgi:hypothetical protein
MKNIKISSKYPFDYKNIKNDAKYMYISNGKPHIVLQDDGKKRSGIVISTYSDGISINGFFNDNSFTFEKDSLTKNINEGLSEWLILNNMNEFVC